MTSLNSEKIRKELEKLLADPIPDRSKILELSLKYSELDKDSVRFSVDASHISRLGRELVVKKETAVSELAKNAYDADATQVTLTFEDAELAGGNLIIDDDGNGMNRNQLIAGFMRISTPDKIHDRYSPKYKRLRAGRKGIGRFAAHRLGKKLTVITQTKDMSLALQVEIDWAKFEMEQELVIISNQVKEIAKTKKHGTTLVIHDLEDGWTVDAIKKTYRYLNDLLQPFPISKTFGVEATDPGFDVKITTDLRGEKQEIASIEKIIYDNALAIITAKVDQYGKGSWSIKSKQLEIDEKNLPSAPKEFRYSHIKDVNLKAYYYIHSSEVLPKNVIKQIRELAEERGGIRVYRNGFRVLPYGESNDDWLHFDERNARRVILPPFRNQNFFGFVELIDPEGSVFEETASREGLLETEGFNELVPFLGDVLESAVIRVAEARGKKTKPVTREIATGERLKKVVSDLNKVVKEITEKSDNKTANTPQVTAEVKHLLQTMASSIDEINDLSNKQIEEKNIVLDELSMLRVLASLGLTIGQFNHEIRHTFPALITDVNRLVELNTSKPAHETAVRLEQNIRNLKVYTSYFDRAVSDNARRETEIQDVANLLRSFWKVATPACTRRGIEFPEPVITGYDLFTMPMHSSEWTSILFNLFTNSQKAIKRAKVQIGKIHVKSWNEDKKIIVEFSDNGDGVPEKNQDRIFDAFFTTSYSEDSYDEDEEDMLGTGLGLKIIKDIATSYGGDVSLVGAPRGYSTCFRVEIPAATQEQVDKYGY